MNAHSRPAVEKSDRSALSKDLIVEAAIEIMDEDGVSALTIRRIGSRIGYSPMSLYKHVESKDDILIAVKQALYAKIEDTVEDQDAFESLKQVMLSTDRVLTAHPCLADLFVSGPRVGLWGDRQRRHIAALQAAGLSERDAFVAFAAVFRFVIGSFLFRSRDEMDELESTTEWGLDLLISSLRTAARTR